MHKLTYSERLSVGFTADQVRRLDEIIRVRARKGQPITKADLIRDAVEFYFLHQDDLPGSRKAIARSVEAKLADVETHVLHIETNVDKFMTWLAPRMQK